MNQKGQAFSVFELMIAGVVAFAILIVLLMVINGVNITGGNSARDTISNGIKSVSPSGTMTTQKFSINPNDQILSSDFSEKTGLDPKSIFFLKGQFLSSSSQAAKIQIGTTSTTQVAYLQWTGSTALNAKAKIICGQTDADTADKLGLLDSALYDTSATDPTSYCANTQPCCAVVLEKPTN